MKRAVLAAQMGCLLVCLFSCAPADQRTCCPNTSDAGALVLTVPKSTYTLDEDVYYFLSLHLSQRDEYVLSCVDAAVLTVELRGNGKEVQPIPYLTDNPSTIGRTTFAGVYDRQGDLVYCPTNLVRAIGLHSLSFLVPLNFETDVSHEVFDLAPGNYTLRVSYFADFGFENTRIIKELGVTEIAEARVFGIDSPLISNEVSFRVK